MAKDVSPKPPSPETIVPARPQTAKVWDMAYGQGEFADSHGNLLYRVERGTLFRRAGVPVSTNAKFGAQPSIGKVSNAALTNAGVDPTKSGFITKGSTPQTVSAPNFSFNAGSTTTLTISWSAYASRRADGTAIVLQAGSLSITGLTANTLYYYFPFWSEAAQAIGFVNGGGSGTPKVAYTSVSDLNIQQQNLQGNFSFGIIQFTQPASGTSSGTSGNNSGAGTGGGGQAGGGRVRANLT